ncbi:MAG: ATP-binding protein [Maritimibacter sp.]
MSFVNHSVATTLAALKDLHYTFPRETELSEGFEWIITDYWAKASTNKDFEARGLLVTGPSRVGKTSEIKHVLNKVNDGSTIMPDGRPAHIVSVTLAGRLSWKDLGVHTLRKGLRFPTQGKSRMTQRQIWDMVGYQAREQGVHGIHYDECQHIFPANNEANRAMLLDSFKSLLKDPDWPFMLILSGVDELVHHIGSDEQLAFLLRPVRFREISFGRNEDVHELNRLCFAYADKAGVDFTPLSSTDFYRRLSCATANRWGRAIELVIEALIDAVEQGDKTISSAHFCRAFTSTLGLPPGYSPFSVDDFEPLFAGETVFKLWEKHRSTIPT